MPNNHFHTQAKNMTRDRQTRILEQSTETVVEAQAALDRFQASHARYSTSRKAYRIAEAQERVAAAKRRPNALVMAWGEARAASMEADMRLTIALCKFENGEGRFPWNIDNEACDAEQDAVLAWQAVENQRAGQRAREQVEALRPVAARLMDPALRREWQASGGI